MEFNEIFKQLNLHLTKYNIVQTYFVPESMVILPKFIEVK